MVKRQPDTVDAIMDKFHNMYSSKGTTKLPQSFATTLRFFCNNMCKEKTLAHAEQVMWNNLTNIGKAGFTDWQGLLDRVSSERKKPLDKKGLTYGLKAKANMTVMEIARSVKKEEDERKLEKTMDTPDYDSTYVPPS